MRTKQTCRKCNTERPMQFFRAWRGPKIVWRSVCTVCKPEPTLAALSAKQRVSAAAYGRAHGYVVRMMNEQEALRINAKRAEIVRRRHARRWREAWMDALVTPLRKERNYIRQRMKAANIEAEREYLEEYNATLNEMLGRILPHIQTKPSPEGLDIRRYIPQGAVEKLRRRYSLAPVKRKEPMFLEWGYATPLDEGEKE